MGFFTWTGIIFWGLVGLLVACGIVISLVAMIIGFREEDAIERERDKR